MRPRISHLDPSFNRVAASAINTLLDGRAENYTVASLPPAVAAGRIVFVSNEVGGAVLAFSDGANWRRVTDRAIVS